tara:strand:+ start:3017 stop:3283 length:267 start_codon:yes stop_codon:yes gene_type:complete
MPLHTDIERLEDKLQRVSSEYHNAMYNTMDTKGNWSNSNKLLNDVINYSIILRDMKLNEAKKKLEKAFTPRLKKMLQTGEGSEKTNTE